MQETKRIKPECPGCRRVRHSMVPLIIFAVLLLIVAIALGGCALDRDRLATAREDIRAICDDAVSLPLRRWCASVIVPEVPAEEPSQ